MDHYDAYLDRELDRHHAREEAAAMTREEKERAIVEADWRAEEAAFERRMREDKR